MPESDRSEFARVVVCEAPLDPAPLCDGGGINEPSHRRIGRVCERIDDGVDGVVPWEFDDPPGKLLNRHGRQLALTLGSICPKLGMHRRRLRLPATRAHRVGKVALALLADERSREVWIRAVTVGLFACP